MRLSVSEMAKLCGVSVRTLHYYEEIGLLHPETAAESGYRWYGAAEIETMQQILFFRELDFPLKEIGVKEVTVDLEKGKVTVKAVKEISEADMTAAITAAGYKVV